MVVFTYYYTFSIFDFYNHYNVRREGMTWENFFPTKTLFFSQILWSCIALHTYLMGSEASADIDRYSLLGVFRSNQNYAIQEVKDIAQKEMMSGVLQGSELWMFWILICLIIDYIIIIISCAITVWIPVHNNHYTGCPKSPHTLLFVSASQVITHTILKKSSKLKNQWALCFV